MRYRQEHYAGQAEDMAEVLSVREQAEVPLGDFTDVVATRAFTALEPRVVEYKLYARAVGQVLALDVSGAAGRESWSTTRRRLGTAASRTVEPLAESTV